MVGRAVRPELKWPFASYLVNSSWLSRCSLIQSLWRWTIFAPAWKPCGIIWYALYSAGLHSDYRRILDFVLVR